MPLNLRELTPEVRRLMLEEIAHDEQAGCLNIGKRLNESGCTAWPSLLRRAVESGTDQTLAADIRTHRCLKQFEQRRKPKGGFTSAAVPENAAETLAEGEFNRFYIRALCRHAMVEKLPTLTVYRAKSVSVPRPQSELLIGKQIAVEQLLNDLRTNPGVDTALGLPPGPNSGLSACLTQ